MAALKNHVLCNLPKIQLFSQQIRDVFGSAYHATNFIDFFNLYCWQAYANVPMFGNLGRHASCNTNTFILYPSMGNELFFQKVNQLLLLCLVMRLLLSTLSRQRELSTSFCRRIMKFLDFLINNPFVILRFVQKHGNITKDYSDLKEIQNFCISMDLINFMHDGRRMYRMIPPSTNVRLYYIHILGEIVGVHMKIKAVGFSPRLIMFLRGAFPVNVPFTFRSKINAKNLKYPYHIDNKSSPKEQILQKLFALLLMRCLISKKQERYYNSLEFPSSRIFETAELLEEKLFRLMVLFRSFLEAYDKFELDDYDKIISISMELDDEYNNEFHRLKILENAKRSIFRLEPIVRAWKNYSKNNIAKRFHIKRTNIKKTIEHLLCPDDMPDDNKILRYKQIENQLLIPI